MPERFGRKVSSLKSFGRSAKIPMQSRCPTHGIGTQQKKKNADRKSAADGSVAALLFPAQSYRRDGRPETAFQDALGLLVCLDDPRIGPGFSLDDTRHSRRRDPGAFFRE